jgi:hypothetical protein
MHFALIYMTMQEKISQIHKDSKNRTSLNHSGDRVLRLSMK